MHKLELEAGRMGREDDLSTQRAAREDARKDAETTARIDAQTRMAQARENAALAAQRFDNTNRATGMASVSPADVAAGGDELGNLSL